MNQDVSSKCEHADNTKCYLKRTYSGCSIQELVLNSITNNMLNILPIPIYFKKFAF